MNGKYNSAEKEKKQEKLLSQKRNRENDQVTNEAEKCPYLNTIKRHLLDFDFEKNCSISNSKLNIYACLVCGKYLQGRGKSTHAYLHSLEREHYLFISLSTETIYCLPDNYEVTDNSLEDIKRNLRPKYTKREIKKLDEKPSYSYALDGQKYLQGCIGLNNIKCTDYANVIIQSLFKIKSLRDFFLSFDRKTENVFLFT